jgi:hypothetical protein
MGGSCIRIIHQGSDDRLRLSRAPSSLGRIPVSRCSCLDIDLKALIGRERTAYSQGEGREKLFEHEREIDADIFL